MRLGLGGVLRTEQTHQGRQGTWEALTVSVPKFTGRASPVDQGPARRGRVPPRRERTKDAGYGTAKRGTTEQAGRTSAVTAPTWYR